jgi:hypothetical protein
VGKEDPPHSKSNYWQVLRLMPVIPATWEAKRAEDGGSRPSQAKSFEDSHLMSINKLGVVVYAYDPNYSGGYRQEDLGLRPVWAKT